MDPEYSKGDSVIVAVGAWKDTQGTILEHDEACDDSHMYKVQLSEDEGDSTWFFENELMDPRSQFSL